MIENERDTEGVAEEHSLLVERIGSVLVMTINRPHRKNAIDYRTAVALESAMRELDQNADLAVGVLTGAGGVFSAGMDLSAFLRGERPVTVDGGFAGFAQRPPAKPLIAAVEGWALAGGFEMVLACDLVVAGAAAKFGLPEVKRGLVARGGGAFTLPQRIPRAIALEMLLTGDPMSTAELAAFGLINQVVPDGSAVNSAIMLAVRIAANAPLALAATKQIVVQSRDWWVRDSFVNQELMIGPVFASDDAREGSRAFVEKRLPVWAGR